jgi:hypothetical protein
MKSRCRTNIYTNSALRRAAMCLEATQRKQKYGLYRPVGLPTEGEPCVFDCRPGGFAGRLAGDPGQARFRPRQDGGRAVVQHIIAAVGRHGQYRMRFAIGKPRHRDPQRRARQAGICQRLAFGKRIILAIAMAGVVTWNVFSLGSRFRYSIY